MFHVAAAVWSRGLLHVVTDWDCWDESVKVNLPLPVFFKLPPPSVSSQSVCWCVARDDVHACSGCLHAHASARACGPVVMSWRTPPPRAPLYLTPALSIPFLLPLFLRLPNLQKTPLSAHISFYSSGEWLWLVPLIKKKKKKNISSEIW